jgi:hypothetical protein
MYSPDYYIRLPHGRRVDIAFEHLYTEQDPAVCPVGLQLCRAGITEWIGQWGDACVSLGWDWAQMEDGSIWALKAVPPRTNLMSVDAKGYDMPCEQGLGHFWALIDTLPWRNAVFTALHERRPSYSPRTTCLPS